MKFTAIVARVVSLGLVLAVAHPAVAQQQPYPSKAVRYILPYPPGGSTDPMARFICGKLAEVWGKSVVVDANTGEIFHVGDEGFRYG